MMSDDAAREFFGARTRMCQALMAWHSSSAVRDDIELELSATISMLTQLNRLLADAPLEPLLDMVTL